MGLKHGKGLVANGLSSIVVDMRLDLDVLQAFLDKRDEGAGRNLVTYNTCFRGKAFVSEREGRMDEAALK